MPRFTTSHWRVPVASLIALGAIAAPASAANVIDRPRLKVAKLVDKAGGHRGRPDRRLRRPEAGPGLRPRADLSYYTLAPQGDFEAASSWTLGSGATLVAQSSPFSTGAQALSLGANGTAVTPAFCVDVTQPTMRFFVRNAGPAACDSERRRASFTDLTGKAKSLQIAKLTRRRGLGAVRHRAADTSTSWRRSPRPARRAIQLRFTAASGKGAWVIDDVEIDPFRPR